jgi:pSer/pThr/pTyr-binding forkhead associated (FHA) protein
MSVSLFGENMTGLILLVLRLGLTLALYAFLIYAVRAIWQDLRQQTQSATLNMVPPIYLKPLGNGQETIYKLNEITLGRSPSCDMCIQDETVSAVHARLYYRKNQWWVEDKDSSNGSKLNGLPIETPTVLTAGDELTLGSFNILINFHR